MLRAIVGIEIDIERVDAKAKFSQNRPPPDRASVADGVAADGHHAASQATRPSTDT